MPNLKNIDKKSKSSWYTAITHFLTTFAFTAGLLLILGLISAFIYPDITSLELTAFDIFFAIIILLLVFIGTKYSSNHIKKKYIIKNKNKVINFSTSYLVIIIILNLIAGISITNTITAVLILGIFYLGSRKFIENNADETHNRNKPTNQ